MQSNSLERRATMRPRTIHKARLEREMDCESKKGKKAFQKRLQNAKAQVRKSKCHVQISLIHLDFQIYNPKINRQKICVHHDQTYCYFTRLPRTE